MLQYDINSWHYRLVLYVYGEEFFSTKYIDHSMIKTDEDIENMYKFPEKFAKTKPKHVNFCPYCRAVAVSIFLLPLSAILKRIPQKKRQEMTLLELKKSRERRMRIILGGLGSFHFVLGLFNIIAIPDGIWAGVIQISLGFIFLFFPEVSKTIKKAVPHLISFYDKPKSVLVRSKIRNVGSKIKPILVRLKILKVKIKIRPRKIPRQHSPSFIRSFFSEKHDKYCPPVFFVDKKIEEANR